MGREVGGGFRMGTRVHPWLIHVSVWQKPPQYYKVIKINLLILKILYAIVDLQCLFQMYIKVIQIHTYTHTHIYSFLYSFP